MIPQMMTPGDTIRHMQEFPDHDMYSATLTPGDNTLLRLDCLTCVGQRIQAEKEADAQELLEKWKEHPEKSYGEMIDELTRGKEEIARGNDEYPPMGGEISRGRNRSSEARTVR